MNETADRTESVFAAAAALASLDERALYLQQACGSDLALRERVEALLRAHDRPGHFLDQRAKVSAAPEETAGDTSAGERVGTLVAGRYKLLEQIGEGGMGAVWVAEQTQPVRRKVALKLIKAGMDSKTVLSRFEAERQALALMDHPNIAKVLDGGTTDRGRPFFVMEYVKGVPIAQYCDDARLSVPERLELFVPVCQAVQHAHQKGIIHRDLKPSNILVCLYDGRPVPKVIDFGLAKAMHQPLTEHTLYTAHGLMMGTPLYMSPEQAELNNLDVDTRTDVYALGVILYELLTGSTPLEKKRFQAAAWQEMLRLIKDEEPPRPSTRLSGSALLPSVAAQRRVEPVKLTKLVRGELDWIVMKALEKDRTRRYETANGLARDIERYLRDEAVEACPPSAAYRLRKFARRYRATLVTVAAFAFLLVGGAAVCVWLALGAMEAEHFMMLATRQAVQQREEAEGQRDRALKAEAAARENEQRARNHEKKAGELAFEMMELLQVFRNEVRDATTAFKDRGKLDQALTFYEQALDGVRAKVGPANQSTYISMANLAEAYVAAGQPEKALALAEALKPLMITGPGVDHPATFWFMSSLAGIYQATAKRDQAIAMFEQNLATMKEKLGPNHPVVIRGLDDLAKAYEAAGQQAKALPLWEHVIEIQKMHEGPEHPKVLENILNLAGLYREAGRLDKAVPMYEDSLATRIRLYGRGDDRTLVAMSRLARAYLADGKVDQATPMFKETLTAWKAKKGNDAPDTLIAMHDLATAYRSARKLQDALSLLEPAVAGFKKHYGLTTGEARLFQRDLADLYERMNHADRAEPLRRELVTATKEKVGPESAACIRELRFLGVNLIKQRKHAAAEPVWRECLALREKTQADDWTTFDTKALLGATLLRQKKYADAEPLLLAGYEGLKQREAKIPAANKVRLTEVPQRLVDLYEALDKKEEAARWRKEVEVRQIRNPKSEIRNRKDSQQ